MFFSMKVYVEAVDTQIALPIWIKYKETKTNTNYITDTIASRKKHLKGVRNEV